MQTAKREQIMAALLSAPSVSAAARSSGIPESTIRRWLARDDFRQEYDALRAEVVQGACRTLQDRMTEACTVVVNLMHDQTANAQTRLYAARTVLEYGFKATEELDILHRLERLEAAEND